MKKLITPLALCALLMACNKNEDPVSGPNAAVERFTELQVSDDFNWSTSDKNTLTVEVTSDTALFTAEGEMLYLVDDNGTILDRRIVAQGKADFSYAVPAQGTSLSILHPNTGLKAPVSENGTVKINVPNLLSAGFAEMRAGINGNNGSVNRLGKTMGNVIVNGDFSSNSFETFPSNYQLNTGVWYVKQKNNNNYYRWANISGSRRYKFEDDDDGWAYQLVSVNGGENYSVSALASDDDDVCLYLYFFNSNFQYTGYRGFGPNNNDIISGSGTIPNNTAYVLVKIHGEEDEWIDNVVLDIVNPIQDADNDGVADADDDYPNDASRAYDSYFPTSGYQTVAFEDLWPFQGDYDFNDVVLDNRVQFVRNASNELVEASFTISLEAVGSGFSNGLAVVLLDQNNNPITQNMIASVSGDATLDPNVTNGIVVFNDVFLAQSTYYQNNGQGPSATPDVFTFTVTFNANAGTRLITPDTYIFRTNNRGLEIHLPGFSGTSAANTALYNTGDDVNGTYKTATGLPWAIEIISTTPDFRHPNEKVDITQAYPNFQTWAESEGTQATNWLDNFTNSLVFGVL